MSRITSSTALHADARPHDLEDSTKHSNVSLVTPLANNEVLAYNSTTKKWENKLQGGTINNASNLGAGEGHFAQENAGVLEFKSTTVTNPVVGSTPLTISSTPTEVDINFNPVNLDHQAIGGTGSYSHQDIDLHIDDTNIHYAQTSIDHTNLLNKGVNSHADIDTHIGDSTIHFTSKTTEDPLDPDRLIVTSSSHNIVSHIRQTGSYTFAQLNSQPNMNAHYVAADASYVPTTWTWNDQINGFTRWSQLNPANITDQGNYLQFNNGVLGGSAGVLELQGVAGAGIQYPITQTGFTTWAVVENLSIDGTPPDFGNILDVSNAAYVGQFSFGLRPGSNNLQLRNFASNFTTTGNNYLDTGFDIVNATGKQIIIMSCENYVWNLWVNNTQLVTNETSTATPISPIGYLNLGSRQFNSATPAVRMDVYDVGYKVASSNTIEQDDLFIALASEYAPSLLALGDANIELTQMTDVTLSNPASGDVLYYNGAEWVNQPDFVDTTSGQTLSNKGLIDAQTFLVNQADNTKLVKFDLNALSTLTTNTLQVHDISSDWILTRTSSDIITNKTINASDNTILIAVSQLSDVTISSAVTGHSLFYNGSAWVNRPSNNGTIKINNGNGLQPTYVGLTVAQAITYASPLGISSFPTSSPPLAINNGVFADADIYLFGTNRFLEQQLSSTVHGGQIHLWRFILDYSNKNSANSGNITITLSNALSGFVAKATFPLPQGVTAETDRYAEIITIADNASKLPAVGGTGQGYDFTIESTTSVDVTITSIARIAYEYSQRS